MGQISGGPNIIDNGLVLSLDAADGNSYPGSGTTWIDVSGNGHNGTLNGGAAFITSNGGILDFDGTDDFISTGNPSTLNIQYASHEIWFKLDSPNNSVAQQIMARRNVNNGTFTIAKSAINRLTLNTRNSSDTLVGLTLNTLPSTDWTQIVHTYDGTTISGYVNGILDNSTTSLSGPLNTGGSFDLVIAQNNGNTNRMDGKIGMVRIYNRALTASEVLQNYNAVKSRFGL